MSNIPYYSQHARLKAIEYCNTVSVLKDLLNDIDAQIREAALKKISTTNKLTKEMIYKMLESDDVEVRLKGLSLLKEQNKD
jgi:HEAT repeat protein